MTEQEKPKYMFTEGGVVRYMSLGSIQREYFTNQDGSTFRSRQWIQAGLDAGATTVAELVYKAEIRQKNARIISTKAARKSPFGKPIKGIRNVKI